MRVRYDDQIFTLQPRGGISRYFVELMRCYVADPSLGVRPEPRRMWTRNQHLVDAGRGCRLQIPLGDRRRALASANAARPRRPGASVVHHTYYDVRYLRRGIGGARRAVTVYDMVPEIFPELFPSGNPHLAKRDFVAAADVVFCISEATRDDLVAHYGRPAAPIVVTPLGVDPAFGPDQPPAAGLPERYLLHVGNRAAYKDFPVLVRALGAAGLPNDVRLVVTGGGPLTSEEHELLAEQGWAQRTVKRDLSDTDLARAYAHALCFVFPSRYEGFGLPTVEAMASGCPAVLADSSSHPEVGGDAAVYFPPGDVDALAGALRRVVDDVATRTELSIAGLARASRFTWARTAELTAEAYQALGAVAR